MDGEYRNYESVIVNFLADELSFSQSSVVLNE